jgi:hypothetical protein
VPIIAIILLVSFVAPTSAAAGSDALSAQADRERIAPVGSVEVKDLSTRRR